MSQGQPIARRPPVTCLMYSCVGPHPHLSGEMRPAHFVQKRWLSRSGAVFGVRHILLMLNVALEVPGWYHNLTSTLDSEI